MDLSIAGAEMVSLLFKKPAVFLAYTGNEYMGYSLSFCLLNIHNILAFIIVV